MKNIATLLFLIIAAISTAGKPHKSDGIHGTPSPTVQYEPFAQCLVTRTQQLTVLLSQRNSGFMCKTYISRINLQWSFGTGPDYNRWRVTINAPTGLTKVMNRTFEHLRRNILCISVGYTF